MATMSSRTALRQQPFHHHHNPNNQNRRIIKGSVNSDYYETVGSKNQPDEPLQPAVRRRTNFRRSPSPVSTLRRKQTTLEQSDGYTEMNSSDMAVSHSKHQIVERSIVPSNHYKAHSPPTFQESGIENKLSDELKMIPLSPINNVRKSLNIIDSQSIDDVTLDSWGREMRRLNNLNPHNIMKNRISKNVPTNHNKILHPQQNQLQQHRTAYVQPHLALGSRRNPATIEPIPDPSQNHSLNASFIPSNSFASTSSIKTPTASNLTSNIPVVPSNNRNNYSGQNPQSAHQHFQQDQIQEKRGPQHHFVNRLPQQIQQQHQQPQRNSNPLQYSQQQQYQEKERSPHDPVRHSPQHYYHQQQRQHLHSQLSRSQHLQLQNQNGITPQNRIMNRSHSPPFLERIATTNGHHRRDQQNSSVFNQSHPYKPILKNSIKLKVSTSDENTLTTEEESWSANSPLNINTTRSLVPHRSKSVGPIAEKRVTFLPKSDHRNKEEFNSGQRSFSVPRGVALVTPSPKSIPQDEKHSNSSPNYFNFSERKSENIILNKKSDESSVKDRIKAYEPPSPQSLQENRITSQQNSIRDRVEIFDIRKKKGSYQACDERSQISTGSSVANYVKALEDKSRELAKRQNLLEKQIKRRLSLSPTRARKSHVYGMNSRITQNRSKSASSAMKASALNDNLISSSPKRKWKLNSSPLRLGRQKYFSVEDENTSMPSIDHVKGKKNEIESAKNVKFSLDSDRENMNEKNNFEYIPVSMPPPSLLKKGQPMEGKLGGKLIDHLQSTDNNNIAILKTNKSDLSSTTESTSNSVKFRAKFFEAARKLRQESMSSQNNTNQMQTQGSTARNFQPPTQPRPRNHSLIDKEKTNTNPSSESTTVLPKNNNNKNGNMFNLVKTSSNDSSQLSSTLVMNYSSTINSQLNSSSGSNTYKKYNSNDFSADDKRQSLNSNAGRKLSPDVFLSKISSKINSQSHHQKEQNIDAHDEKCACSKSSNSTFLPAKFVVAKTKPRDSLNDVQSVHGKSKDLVSLGGRGTVKQTIELMNKRNVRLQKKQQRRLQNQEHNVGDDDDSTLSSITNPLFGEQCCDCGGNNTRSSLRNNLKFLALLEEAEKGNFGNLLSIVKDLDELRTDDDLIAALEKSKTTEEFDEERSPKANKQDEQNILKEGSQQVGKLQETLEAFVSLHEEESKKIDSIIMQSNIEKPSESPPQQSRYISESSKPSNDIKDNGTQKKFTSVGGIVVSTSKLRALSSKKGKKTMDINNDPVRITNGNKDTSIDDILENGNKNPLANFNKKSHNPFENDKLESNLRDERKVATTSHNPFDQESFEISAHNNQSGILSMNGKSSNPFDDHISNHMNHNTDNKMSTNPFDEDHTLSNSNHTDKTKASSNPFDENHDFGNVDRVDGKKQSTNPFDEEISFDKTNFVENQKYSKNPFDTDYESLKGVTNSFDDSNFGDGGELRAKNSLVASDSDETEENAFCEDESEQERFEKNEDTSRTRVPTHPQSAKVPTKQSLPPLHPSLYSSTNSNATISELSCRQNASSASTHASFDTHDCCDNECTNYLQHGFQNVVNNFGYAMSNKSPADQRITDGKKNQLRKISLKTRQKLSQDKRLAIQYINGKFNCCIINEFSVKYQLKCSCDSNDSLN